MTKKFGDKKPIHPFIREHHLNYSLPLNLCYELDLWGLLKSNYQSALYFAESQEAAFQTALLVLTTDLAHCYFRLKTLDAQIDLYLTTIETRKTAAEINKSRYEEHLINFSDVSRADLELTNVEAEYYHAIRLREIEENRIATLVGLPASEFTLGHSPLKEGPPSIPAGMPSDILLQRPDIAQAERRMASEHAQVRVAYASYFPSFSLTGALGFSSPVLDLFLKRKSRLWSVGTQAVQTIFDGGELGSNLDLAWARFKEADRAYQQQVLVAFQEVEDALVSLEWLFKESEKIELSVKSAKATYQIASDRYYHGITFYLDVVDSERDELNTKQALIDLQGLRHTATIQLIKALGGSWKQE